MLPVTCTFLWLFYWIFTVCALDGQGNFTNVNDATDDDVPSVTAKIGEDLTIKCSLVYELDFFAWYVCRSDCHSRKAWELVVRFDNGEREIFNPKFGVDHIGSLIMKDIQLDDDNKWVICFYQEHLVGQDHRSTIIRVAQEPIITSTSRREYEVIESMPILMFCEVRGYPPPWVAWIRKGQVLQNKTSGLNYFLGHNATTEDAGNYTCIAGNFVGVTSVDYQLTVRVDCPPGESTASPQTHSTVKRPTEESKLTSEAPTAVKRPTEESKLTSEAPSAVKRPTEESKLTSEAPSADTFTTRKTNQESISAGDCAGIVTGVAIFAVVIASAVTVWCLKRRVGNQPRVAVQFKANSAHDDDFTSDDDVIDVTDDTHA